MRRVVVLVLDGLRRDFLREEWTPNLASLAKRAEGFARHRSVFPSATRTSAASIATGCHPARHGLQGDYLAFLQGDSIAVHDAGEAGFLQRKRRITGASLAAPTLAERLKGIGGAAIFGNVSPGATYAHDPDGHGHVYHREGSYGPGLAAMSGIDNLGVTPDLAGDRKLTARFVSDLFADEPPALSLLWLAEPDTTQHEAPLGSPAHSAMLGEADSLAGRVFQAVDRLRDRGDDVLLIACSDHGHQTVSGEVDIDAALVEAGLKKGPASDDVVVVSNGTSALIYVHPRNQDASKGLYEFLATRTWVDRAIPAEDLHQIGQSSAHGLAIAVSMRSTEDANGFGIPGTSLMAKKPPGTPSYVGFGQHGGLAAHEQSPFLLMEGEGFAAGRSRLEQTAIIDIAPTVLRHLRLPVEGLDGHALQPAGDGSPLA